MKVELNGERDRARGRGDASATRRSRPAPSRAAAASRSPSTARSCRGAELEQTELRDGQRIEVVAAIGGGARG